MPPKKVVKKVTKPVTDENSFDSESSSEHVNEKTTQNSINIPQSMYLTSNSVKTSDSDRIQLAHAINNFTIKSDQFIQEMKNFDSFRENVFKLDLIIDSKKQEHKHTIESIDLEFITKKKNLENQYAELAKKCESEYADKLKKHGTDHADRLKKCESEFADKNKMLANAYEDESIQMRRKLELDKAKTCGEYAKNQGMRFVKEEEYKGLTDNVQKSLHDYTELKKTFDKQCAQIKEEEKTKYQNQLKNDTVTMDLTHKASNAQLVAQAEQQKKEIKVLSDTIENLKSELREQRELTKQVAQASSKSQITQTIGKN